MPGSISDTYDGPGDPDEPWSDDDGYECSRCFTSIDADEFDEFRGKCELCWEKERDEREAREEDD